MHEIINTRVYKSLHFVALNHEPLCEGHNFMIAAEIQPATTGQSRIEHALRVDPTPFRRGELSRLGQKQAGAVLLKGFIERPAFTELNALHDPFEAALVVVVVVQGVNFVRVEVDESRWKSLVQRA